MAIPNPMPAGYRLSQALAEFGLGAGSRMSQLRRAPGGVVPNTAQNANVPQSAPLRLSQLAGAANYTAMSVSAPNVTGDTGGQTGAPIGSSSATVTGGQAPFSYAWTNTGGTSFPISSPSSAGTSFIRSGRPPAGSVSGTYRCTVTDGTGATAFANITVTDNRSSQ